MGWNDIEETAISLNICEEMSNADKLSFVDAVRCTLFQAMELDDSVFIMGQGVNDQIGMFGMTTALRERFGERRCFDTPLAEAGLTGIAVGVAMAGYHPIYFHNRPDFLYLCMDQLINHASKIHYMSGGQYDVPLIMWAVTGQGWGSAAQHSQTIHGVLMHVPGLKLAMPTTPYDVKGLLCTALEDKNPILFLDHRRLHGQIGLVPKEIYKIPFGKGAIRKTGKDVTIVGISVMVIEAIKAAQELEKEGVDVEIIDLRTIKPYDKEMIVESVKKTGRLLIADTGWRCCGAASEIASSVYESVFSYLKGPIEIIALPDVPTPAAYNLEAAFYKTDKDVFYRVLKMVKEG